MVASDEVMKPMDSKPKSPCRSGRDCSRLMRETGSSVKTPAAPRSKTARVKARLSNSGVHAHDYAMRQFDLRLLEEIIEIADEKRAVLLGIPAREIFQNADDLQVNFEDFAAAADIQLKQVADIEGAFFHEFPRDQHGILLQRQGVCQVAQPNRGEIGPPEQDGTEIGAVDADETAFDAARSQARFSRVLADASGATDLRHRCELGDMHVCGRRVAATASARDRIWILAEDAHRYISRHAVILLLIQVAVDCARK